MTASSTADSTLASSSRLRPTGRVSIARRFPQLASEATASPKKRTTMTTSRNRLMNRSATTGTNSPVWIARLMNASPPGPEGGLSFRATAMMIGMRTVRPSTT